MGKSTTNYREFISAGHFCGAVSRFSKNGYRDSKKCKKRSCTAISTIKSRCNNYIKSQEYAGLYGLCQIHYNMACKKYGYDSRLFLCQAHKMKCMGIETEKMKPGDVREEIKKINNACESSEGSGDFYSSDSEEYEEEIISTLGSKFNQESEIARIKKLIDNQEILCKTMEMLANISKNQFNPIMMTTINTIRDNIRELRQIINRYE